MKREEIKALLQEYEQSCKDYMVARGNSLQSDLVNGVIYAGTSGTYAAYIGMLVSEPTKDTVKWVVNSIRKDITKNNEDITVFNLVKEYAADPNCYPQDWLTDREMLDDRQKKMFMELAIKERS